MLLSQDKVCTVSSIKLIVDCQVMRQTEDKSYSIGLLLSRVRINFYLVSDAARLGPIRFKYFHFFGQVQSELYEVAVYVSQYFHI